MKTRAIWWTLAIVALIAFVAWIASNTYWKEVTVPMPPKGEALTNPHYVAQRFAAALGARAVRDEALGTLPPPQAVVILADWHWSLSAPRRQALERWVESGGRLVVDRSLVGGEEEFERWSGIESLQDYDEEEKEDAEEDEAGTDTESDPAQEPQTETVFQPFRPQCRQVTVAQGAEDAANDPLGDHVSVCGFDTTSSFASNRRVSWSLRDETGIQAIRVPVGKGSVTAINATPFRYRGLFDGGHGALFVTATQLKRGDQIHFRSETEHPSVFALTWQYGAPAVVLMLAFIAFSLWRGAVRLGPVTAEPERARRSLAEQIRGTGQFALRFGRGDALRAAAVRALEEVAQRRLPGYARLSAAERAEKLAQLTRRDADALSGALHFSGPRRANELRSAIALLEAARRDLLREMKRS